MQVRPKYQVFISSTYSDLHEERQAVAWAILKARHIPAGMENFTASDDRGWRTILSVIDKTDYFILILGGKYGSVDTDGISWTEKEYHYAIKNKIPVLAFIREKKAITADQMEEDSDLRAKLDSFRKLVQKNHLVTMWSTIEQLGNHVNAALHNVIIDDEDRGESRPGWYRGDEMPSIATLDEFARLSTENSTLKQELEQIRYVAQTESFALVDKRENSLPNDLTTIATLKVYKGGIDTLEKMKVEDAAHLAFNLLMPIEIGIQNIGNSLVEHIVIDLFFENILGVKCGWDGSDFTSNQDRLTPSMTQLSNADSYPDVFERLGESEVKVRFRLPRISVGATEFLPPFLIMGQFHENQSSFRVTYRIAGSNCKPLAYTVNYTKIFERTEFVGEYEVDRDREALYLKYHLPSPTYAFFR